MEVIQEIIVTIEVETNKRTIKHVLGFDRTIEGASKRAAEVFEEIAEALK